MSRAWSLLTIEGVRQYGGNSGYKDDPEAIYRYDSDVANHLQVQTGDIVFIRTGSRVLGVAEIESIVEGTGQKDRLRCPECNATNIKRRLTKLPAWACKYGHFFEEPINEPATVTTYEASYAASFSSAHPALTVDRLQNAVLRPSDQMSIKELDLAHLEPFLPAGAANLLRRYVDRMSVAEETGDNDQGELQSAVAARRRVLREISLRRGQAQFRERLIRRYGMRCQISGYDFSGGVEAAHIRPYAKCEENGVGNGILLRSDLHTLFDLGFIGINPVTLRVTFNPACMCPEYTAYDGVALLVNGTKGPHANALAEHWHMFSRILSKR